MEQARKKHIALTKSHKSQQLQIQREKLETQKKLCEFITQNNNNNNNVSKGKNSLEHFIQQIDKKEDRVKIRTFIRGNHTLKQDLIDIIEVAQEKNKTHKEVFELVLEFIE